MNRTGGIRRKPDSSGAVLDSSATSSPSEKIWVMISIKGEGSNNVPSPRVGEGQGEGGCGTVDKSNSKLVKRLV